MTDRVWILYRREPGAVDEPIHVWVRRCDVFTSRENAVAHLAALIGGRMANFCWTQSEIWPEIEVGDDGRGNWWVLEPAPIDPLIGVLA